MILASSFLILFLLFLNAFFVLAEYAAVKVRPTRVEELIDQGNARAKLIQAIQTNLDEYLSVCQLGVTLASIGLGWIGEPFLARWMEPAVAWTGAAQGAIAHSVAIALAYLLISFLHLLLGELIPKSVVLRSSEKVALLTAVPLRFFHSLFYLPLVVVNACARLILRLLGLPSPVRTEPRSEEELKIILEQSQTSGLMSFRRLLLFENLFDLGNLTARDAMKPRSAVRVLDASAAWEENYALLCETRFSRYPLLENSQGPLLGMIHVKDLFYERPPGFSPTPSDPPPTGGRSSTPPEVDLRPAGGGSPTLSPVSCPPPTVDLKKVARPFLTTTEETPLENLLAELQKRRTHIALVFNAQKEWTGLVTLEDIIEEIIGTVEDEFEREPPVFLSDVLTRERVFLDVQASSLEEAIDRMLKRFSPSELPLPAERIAHKVKEREKALGTYIGRGLVLPHARLESLDKPLLIFGRSDEGIPLQGRLEKAHLIFLLLTPLSASHVQLRLLARIAGLLQSEYVEERLREAASPQQVLEAIRAGETAALG